MKSGSIQGGRRGPGTSSDTEHPSPQRRRFLRAQLLIGSGLAVCPAALLQAEPQQVIDAEHRLSKFFRVSRKLLSPLPLDTHLDERAAVRLLAALNSEYPNFAQQLDLFPDDPGDTDKRSPVAKLIIAAWFLGVVGKTLVTYERALMYRLTADVFPLRSYCVGKPGSWASAPQATIDPQATIGRI